MSYEEAARICGVSMGAFKTRVNRARTMLGKLMDGEEVRDNGRKTPSKAASDASFTN
jgi:DNA-directed RNA polymerase specialized sigma24 family protein